MKSLYKKINSNYVSITNNYMSKRIDRKIAISNKRMNKQFRINNPVLLSFITKSNHFANFKLSGVIKGKKKPLCFTGSLCTMSDLSNIKVFICTENFSPYNRII